MDIGRLLNKYRKIYIIHGIANKLHIILLKTIYFSFVLLYNEGVIQIGGIIMANINVTIRIDKKLKTQADELFRDLGLSFSSAITMFAKQAVREQRIPFEVKRTGTTIQMATDSSVEKLSKDLIEKNIIAYKELAK